MKLLNKLRGERRTAADIRAAVDKVDMPKLRARVGEIEQERRKLLLAGTDEQLLANKAALDGAMLQLERGDVQVEELTRLADEAEAREAAEALDAEHAEASAAKATLDQALADADTVAAQLKAKLDAASAAAKVIARWNNKIGSSPVGEVDRRIPYNSPDIARQRLMGSLR